jgi:hypothetical protein
MTTPPPSQMGDRWYIRPRVVLPIIAALVLLTALLAPDRIAGRTGNDRLSTYSTEPQGAQLLYELAQRLGWRVEQRRIAELPATDPGVIHAVLDPALPPRMGEMHAMLEQVRQGGALLVVLGASSKVIDDSLHVTTTGLGGLLIPRPDADTTACEARSRQDFMPLWPDNRVHLFDLNWTGPPPAVLETFVRIDPDQTLTPARPRANRNVTPRRPGTRSQSAAVGFPYGLGRVVVGSDPDLLRNDVLRGCSYGLDVSAVRMLEYLRDGGTVPRNRIVFDEYHQGYGLQSGTVGAIGSYLGATRSGHLLFQLLGAGLVLLLALAPRTVPPPHDPERMERRSPLEHVDALSRAYIQVGATRTATMRLLRGVRRRVQRGGVRGWTRETDDTFLGRAQEVAPALAPDVARIRDALRAPVSRRDFMTTGVALHRLETTLTRT